MNKISLSALILSITLIMTACGQNTDSHVSASPKRCDIAKIPGKKYAGSGLAIGFMKDGKATYRMKNNDIARVVSFEAKSNCFVTLQDDNTPGLRDGRTFLFKHDLSRLSDWDKESVVLELVK